MPIFTIFETQIIIACNCKMPIPVEYGRKAMWALEVHQIRRV